MLKIAIFVTHIRKIGKEGQFSPVFIKNRGLMTPLFRASIVRDSSSEYTRAQTSRRPMCLGYYPDGVIRIGGDADL